MRRAKHPTPLTLSKLKYNFKSNLWEITEGGITYGLTLEHTRSLKEYFMHYARNRKSARVIDWYNDQDIFTRKEIVTTASS